MFSSSAAADLHRLGLKDPISISIPLAGLGREEVWGGAPVLSSLQQQVFSSSWGVVVWVRRAALHLGFYRPPPPHPTVSGYSASDTQCPHCVAVLQRGGAAEGGGGVKKSMYQQSVLRGSFLRSHKAAAPRRVASREQTQGSETCGGPLDLGAAATFLLLREHGAASDTRVPSLLGPF